jgi:5-methyltetrahydrofolate--homocysteine methyltransferase
MDALVDRENRESLLRDWAKEVSAKDAKRRELVAEAAGKGPKERRPPPSRSVGIPEPPFLGARVLDEISLEGLFPLIDRNTLYRLHWGAKNAKGDLLENLVRTEFEPRLLGFQQEALSGNWIEVHGAYGYFPAAASGEDLVIFDPEDPRREVGRFTFPRQSVRDRLCLSDFFRPLASESAGPEDMVALQLVTVASPRLEKAVESLHEGAYTETYFLHGFGVRLAEAGAEYLHRRIRRELGIGPERGLRYSWGYGACPDPLQHELVFDLLPAREALNMSLTEAGSLVPELSTAALVVHHPEARYFSV